MINIFKKPRSLILIEGMLLVLVVILILLRLNGIEIAALRNFEDNFINKKYVFYSLLIFILLMWIFEYIDKRRNKGKYTLIYDFLSVVALLLFILHGMYSY